MSSIKFINNNKGFVKTPPLSAKSAAAPGKAEQPAAAAAEKDEEICDIFARFSLQEEPEIDASLLKKNIADCLALSNDFKAQRLLAVKIALSICRLDSSSASMELLNVLKENLVESTSAPSKEATLIIIQALFSSPFPQRFIPFAIGWLPSILSLAADKSSSSASSFQGSARQLSILVALSIVKALNPFSLDLVLPILFTAMESTRKWQTRILALQCLSSLSTISSLHTRQISSRLPDIIPHVAQCMSDMKREVKSEGYAVMRVLAAGVESKDIEAVKERLVECIGDPSTVPQCIKAVSGTTFVRDVESPVLALLIPLLTRALLVRNNTPMLRQTTLIISNMCKLVKDPWAVAKFLPDLMGGLEAVREGGSDPEVREIAGGAYDIVQKIILQHSNKKVDDDLEGQIDKVEVNKCLGSVLAGNVVQGVDANAIFTVLRYLSTVVSCLLATHNFSSASIHSLGDNLLEIVPKDKVDEVLTGVFEKVKQVFVKHVEEDTDGHEVVCNCIFSLAYGGMILLKDANLKLCRGDIYGLLGKNGCGKTTLMTAISNGQVDGFPAPDKCRTAYVSHVVKHHTQGLSVFQFVKSQTPLSSDSEITAILTGDEGIGMTTEMLGFEVNSLSGGWRMKLELGLAMLNHADILLLDEPTNHLDAKNVAWLQNYLLGQKQMTCLIVSHDAKFLDAVCSHVIYYQEKRLLYSKGNFSAACLAIPEIASYLHYESGENFKFKFPNPGNLDLMKNKDRKILRVKDVEYKYPGTDRQVLFGVNIGVSLSSRVAITGPNGAGKSTMIKLLTGETIPDAGTVNRHPALRIAYVAQHAFHHLEQHLDSTPNAYIRWRFEFGADKELLAKESRKLSALEKGKIEERNIECICGRQKVKRSWKYEIKYVGGRFDETVWVPRERLLELGFERLVQGYDDTEAARGAFERELTVASVQQHLEDFGLDKEFGTHNYIKGLSGGQKVKVVLAAAMWMKPHILVLDEPTNYLDVQSLNALANAIREYEGGVVMITHNRPFYESVCDEIWEMNAGRLKCVKTKDGKVVAENDNSGGVDGSGDALGSEGSLEKLDADGVTYVTPATTQPAAAPEDEKVRKSVTRKKETRRERIEKNKRKIAKLYKYGPKADGTEYSSDEEVEKFVHID